MTEAVISTAAPEPAAAPAAPAPSTPAPASAAPEAAPAPGLPSRRAESLPGVYTDPIPGHAGDDGGHEKAPEVVAKSDATPPTPAESEHQALVEGEFAGFESQEKATHSFKILRGMHKSLLEREKRADTIARQAASAADAWQREAETHRAEAGRLRAELEQGGRKPLTTARGSEKEPTPAVAAEAEDIGAKPFYETVDWDQYRTILNDHGDVVAANYLEGLREKHAEARLALKLKAALEPYQAVLQGHAQSQTQRAAQSAVDTLRGMKLPDGGAAYPELSDPPTVKAAVQLFEAMYPEMSPHLTQPRVLHMALVNFRNYLAQAGINIPAPAAPTPGALPAPAVPSSSPASTASAAALAAAAASVGAGGGAPPPPAVGMANLSPAQALARSLPQGRIRESIPGVYAD